MKLEEGKFKLEEGKFFLGALLNRRFYRESDEKRGEPRLLPYLCTNIIHFVAKSKKC